VDKKLDKSIKLSDTIKEDEAMELIYNYAEARKWYPVQPKPLGSTDYKYIIMCTEATEDAVEVLADWKRSIGIRTKVFTKEWLEANTEYPTIPFERQIRYYLRDNYATWNAEYFLIVADTDVIPMRACTAGDGGTWASYTDTYYGELSLTDSATGGGGRETCKVTISYVEIHREVCREDRDLKRRDNELLSESLTRTNSSASL